MSYVSVMRNHRNSVGMTMMNSTKQVNKVKPNVNRAANDSLSSPNQPYNQRYLIIPANILVSSSSGIHMASKRHLSHCQHKKKKKTSSSNNLH